MRLAIKMLAAAAIPMAGMLAPAIAADDYPSRPIKIVVPGPAGNAADTYTRFFADKLSGLMKQPVIVENRPGANNLVSIQAAKSAPADGYTLLVGTATSSALNLALYKKLPYDPELDFRWVSGLARGAPVFLVSADSPYKTLPALIAAAKAQPDSLKYGSYAAPYRISFEWLNQLAGMRTVHVPYKGAAQVGTDLIGGQIDFGMMDMGAAMPFLQSGKLVALAVTSETRHPSLPQVPTVVESGYPGYVQYAWVAVAVRAETPEPIVRRLGDAMLRIMAMPEAQEFALKQGTPLMPLGPEAMQKFNNEEIAKYKRIVATAGIEPQ